jgi:hypothetical protein
VSYSSIETQLLALVRRLGVGAVFGEANSSRNDWGPMDTRGTDVVAVVQMADRSLYGPEVAASWAGAYGTQGDTAALHTVAVTVAAKRGPARGGDGAVYDRVEALAGDLVAHLIAYPTLDGLAGVEQAQITQVGRPGELLRGPDAKIGAYVGQRIIVQVLESL